MQEMAVICIRLQGVTDSVSEIENTPQSTFALVDGDYFCLEAYALSDQPFQFGGIAGQDFVSFFLEMLE